MSFECGEKIRLPGTIHESRISGNTGVLSMCGFGFASSEGNIHRPTSKKNVGYD